MAVVVKYGSGYKDPAAIKAADAIFAEASMKAINSQITITNGDSIASNYFVGRVPSNAIIAPVAEYRNQAIAGVTSFSLGFAAAGAQLVSAVSLAVASALGVGVNAMVAVPLANLNQKAWQLAGLSSDPGGMLDIVATINAAATATGVVTFTIPYSRK